MPAMPKRHCRHFSLPFIRDPLPLARFRQAAPFIGSQGIFFLNEPSKYGCISKDTRVKGASFAVLIIDTRRSVLTRTRLAAEHSTTSVSSSKYGA